MRLTDVIGGVNFTASFSWDEVWQRYVQTTRECLLRAKAHGPRSVEPHTNCPCTMRRRFCA